METGRVDGEAFLIDPKALVRGLRKGNSLQPWHLRNLDAYHLRNRLEGDSYQALGELIRAETARAVARNERRRIRRGEDNERALRRLNYEIGKVATATAGDVPDLGGLEKVIAEFVEYRHQRVMSPRAFDKLADVLDIRWFEVEKRKRFAPIYEKLATLMIEAPAEELTLREFKILDAVAYYYHHFDLDEAHAVMTKSLAAWDHVKHHLTSPEAGGVYMFLEHAMHRLVDEGVKEAYQELTAREFSDDPWAGQCFGELCGACFNIRRYKAKREHQFAELAFVELGRSLAIVTQRPQTPATLILEFNAALLTAELLAETGAAASHAPSELGDCLHRATRAMGAYQKTARAREAPLCRLAKAALYSLRALLANDRVVRQDCIVRSRELLAEAPPIACHRSIPEVRARIAAAEAQADH